MFLLIVGYYRDCKDAFQQGQTCSGVYMIKPEGRASTRISALAQPPFDVYCDMETNGGGWTVFQRRMDGSQYFNANWTEYAHGFGDLNGEFWLGLSKMHRLTTSSTSLRVDLADFGGDVRYAEYTVFQVGHSKYTLTVSGYHGNAGDALAVHNGSPFTTWDRDNDASTNNCVRQYWGGWWYVSCQDSNLNGNYLYGHHPHGNGVIWRQWKGRHYSLKVTEMKARRR